MDVLREGCIVSAFKRDKDLRKQVAPGDQLKLLQWPRTGAPSTRFTRPNTLNIKATQWTDQSRLAQFKTRCKVEMLTAECAAGTCHDDVDQRPAGAPIIFRAARFRRPVPTREELLPAVAGSPPPLLGAERIREGGMGRMAMSQRDYVKYTPWRRSGDSCEVHSILAPNDTSIPSSNEVKPDASFVDSPHVASLRLAVSRKKEETKAVMDATEAMRQELATSRRKSASTAEYSASM